MQYNQKLHTKKNCNILDKQLRTKQNVYTIALNQTHNIKFNNSKHNSSKKWHNKKKLDIIIKKIINKLCHIFNLRHLVFYHLHKIIIETIFLGTPLFLIYLQANKQNNIINLSMIIKQNVWMHASMLRNIFTKFIASSFHNVLIHVTWKHFRY